MKKILFLVIVLFCAKYIAQAQNQNTGAYIDDYVNRSYDLFETLDTFRRPYVLRNNRRNSSLLNGSGQVEQTFHEIWCGQYLNAPVCNTYFRELGYDSNGLVQEWTGNGNQYAERFEYTSGGKIKKYKVGNYQTDGSFQPFNIVNYLYYPNDSLRSIDSYVRPIDSTRFALERKDSIIYNQQGQRTEIQYFQDFYRRGTLISYGRDTFYYNTNATLSLTERTGFAYFRESYTYNALGQIETKRNERNGSAGYPGVIISAYSYYTDGRVYQVVNSYPGFPKDSCRFTFAYNWPLLSVDSTPQSNDVHIYPSPTTGPLQIELPDRVVLPAFISIYDMSGRMVVQEALTEKTSSLNIGRLNSGMYIYSIRDKNGQVTGKIIKQ